MERENKIDIPSDVQKLWEEQAIREHIPYTEFPEFIRTKEREFLRAQEKEQPRPQIYTNETRNKLTAYGQRVALEYILAIPQIERICKFARYDFEDLQILSKKNHTGKADKENFLWELDHWYEKLKEDMKKYRISKDTMKCYGLDYKAATKFYFAAR